MGKQKKLYKGTFNYAGESYTLYTHAIGEEWAFMNFTSRISKKIDYTPRYVRSYFNRSKDNYYIEEKKKDEPKRTSKTDEREKAKSRSKKKESNLGMEGKATKIAKKGDN